MATAAPLKISKRVEKELHQTKVIIRRLPPDFTEEKFSANFADIPPHHYVYFVPGDPSLGPHGCSRAYIGIIDEDTIVSFRDQYDGNVFETERGMKYRAVVEFAPFQGIPKKIKRKPDSRVGTIEQDGDYKTFFQSLETKPEPLSSVDLLSHVEELEAKRAASVVQTTPLVEFLTERKSARSGRGGRSKYSSDRDGKKKRDRSKTSKSTQKSRSSSEISESKSTKDDGKSKREKGSDKKRDAESVTKGTSQQKEKELSNHVSVERLDTGIGTSDHKATSNSTSVSKEASKGSYRNREEGYKGSRGGSAENGEVPSERGRGDRDKTKNRDRPDRAIYKSRGRSNYDHAGRSSSRDGEGSRGRSAKYGDRQPSSSSGSGQRSKERRENDDRDYYYRGSDTGGGGGGRDKRQYESKEWGSKQRSSKYRGTSGGGGGKGRDDSHTYHDK